MATRATTDGGEEPDYHAVSSFSFHDSSSGHSFRGVRYLNENDEWDTAMWAEDSDDKPTVADAPDFIHRRWRAFRNHRDAAKRELDRLIEKVRRGRECPICGEGMTTTDNEWVIQQLTGCPDYAVDDHTVRFCGNCETNVHYTTESMNAKTVHVKAGNGFDGPSFGLSRSFKSLDKRTRYRSIEKPDKFQDSLTRFHKARVAAMKELGYLEDGDGNPIEVNTVACDYCGDEAAEAQAISVEDSDHSSYPTGVYCSHSCGERARDEVTVWCVRQGAHAAKSYDGDPPVFGPYDDEETARQKAEAVAADPDYVDTGWVTDEALPDELDE